MLKFRLVLLTSFLLLVFVGLHPVKASSIDCSQIDLAASFPQCNIDMSWDGNNGDWVYINGSLKVGSFGVDYWPYYLVVDNCPPATCNPLMLFLNSELTPGDIINFVTGIPLAHADDGLAAILAGNYYVNNYIINVVDHSLPPPTPQPTPSPTPDSSLIWSTPERVNSPQGGYNYYPAIAADKLGNLHAIWQNWPNISYSFKPLNGQWESEVLLSSAFGSDSDIAVDRTGGAHAIWQEYQNRNNEIHYAYKPLGGNWQTNEILYSMVGEQGTMSPRIILDSQGNVYVVWGHNYNIYLTYKAPSGQWSPEIQINSTNRASFPSLFITQDDELYITWMSYDGYSADVYVARFNPDHTISANIKVNDYRSSNFQYPTLVVDSSKNIYLIYDEYDYLNGMPYPKLLFTKGTIDGPWTPSQVIDTYGQGPKIVIDKSDNIYLAWTDRYYDPTVYYSKLNQDRVTWSTPQPISKITAGKWPGLTVDHSGNIYAIWVASDTSGEQIYFSRGSRPDSVAPASTITFDGRQGLNSWYTSDASVTISATDNENGSGVKEIHYVLNGVENIVQGNSTTFTLTSEGVNSLTYWAIDNASNFESQSITSIKIDRSGPTIDIISPVGTISSINPNISVNLDDPISGISSYQYFLAGTDITNTPQLDLTYKTAGDYTFSVNATDNAGNTTNESSTFTYSPTTETLRFLFDKMYADGEITKLGTSLYDKLSLAQRYIDSSNYTDAKTVLNALINQIRAQLDIHVTTFSGNILIANITFLINSLP